MALYSQGQVTTVSGSGAPSFDLKCSATISARLLEFGASSAAATQCTYGLGRPANDGSVTQTTPVLLQGEDGNLGAAVAQTGTAVAWSAAPTVPTVFLRRINTAAQIGAGFVWVFPRGIKCDVSKGLVLWNLVASSANELIWVVCDE